MLTTKMRRLLLVIHRDCGYFFAGLIIIYSLSGIALNHVDDWNPNFIIDRQAIRFEGHYTAASITPEAVRAFDALVGEETHRVYDAPTADQVKIYYDQASLHLNFVTQEGVYEKIRRRPVFYHTNFLHTNSLKGWRWASDVFAVMLIVVSVSGILILKGKKGIGGRGKWLIMAGLIPPILALILSGFV